MIVNPIYINEVVSPLIGGADNEDDIVLFATYDPNNESDVKRIAKEYLLPSYQRQIPELQEEIKNSFAYYLLFPEKVDFESIFDSLLLPLETPLNCYLFFRWIWEVLFPGEEINFVLDYIVVEDFDINAPVKLLVKKAKGNLEP